MGFGIGECSFGGEGGVAHADEDFGFWEDEDVEGEEDFAEMCLSAHGGEFSVRNPEDAGYLSCEGVLATREPIKGVFEHARDGVVVFRGGDHDEVCGCDECCELGD